MLEWFTLAPATSLSHSAEVGKSRGTGGESVRRGMMSGPDNQRQAIWKPQDDQTRCISGQETESLERRTYLENMSSQR